MTRTECENKIMEHLIAIKEIALELDPKEDYLMLSYGPMKQGNADEGWILTINNRYWEKDAAHQIHYSLFSDGDEYRPTFAQEVD